jgi:hypothetical protein
MNPQNDSGVVTSPGKRQPIPMMAIGSIRSALVAFSGSPAFAGVDSLLVFIEFAPLVELNPAL